MRVAAAQAGFQCNFQRETVDSGMRRNDGLVSGHLLRSWLDPRPETGLFLFLLLACLFLPNVGGAATGEPLRIQSVQADFVQEKHMKILARPLVSSGRFLFQAPGSVRWEYAAPVPSLLLMHNGVARKFVSRDGRLQAEPGSGMDGMGVVLAGIGDWLDGRFGDNEWFTVARPDETTVLLTPRGEGVAAVISGIELKLADQAGLLDRVTIFEGPDSRTVLTFSNRRLNEAIPASAFAEP